MKLKEFLSELTEATNVVIVECHSDKEDNERAKYWFPDIHDHILFFGERWEIMAHSEMKEPFNEIGEYEICCVEMRNDHNNNPYIAVFVVNN